jgi:hypothetical protein
VWDVDYGDMLSDEEILAFQMANTVEVCVLRSDEERNILFSKGLTI